MVWQTVISHIPKWNVWFQAFVTLVVPLLVHRLYKSLYRFVDGRVKAGPNNQSNIHNESGPAERTPISGSFHEDLERVKAAIGANSDVVFRDLTVGKAQVRAVIISVKGMQEDKQLNLELTRLLASDAFDAILGNDEPLNQRMARLPLESVGTAETMDVFLPSILYGHMALLVEGLPAGLLISPPDAPSRQLSEPVSEALLRGSRVGFTEELSVNTALLRRQGISEHMQIRSCMVGQTIPKELAIAYIDTIVNPELLGEVQARIEKMTLDYAAESGYIEQLIEDNYFSPFQQAQNTERPDRVFAALLEGKIAILLDGTPFVLIVPTTFSMLLQSPEDYFERWLPGSLLRMLRFVAAFVALMAPALYISFISFHPGLIPTELAITIIETRQGVPFPSLIEVMILEISIEILREAGIRLPKPIGPAMGIVGGLVIGDAAVQAGIVSPFLVIVVAVTAISSFSIPVYSAGITLRLLRFAGMLFAAILGMFGTILFFLLICCHLAKLKSFGVPYLTPITPVRLSDWKDLFIRAPMSLMNQRPKMMKTVQKKRK